MHLFRAAAGLLAGCLAAFAGPSSGAALENLQQGNPQSQHVWRAPGDRIAIPFQWYDGHMLVAVRVNGSAPLRLAFDSGAGATVLFETERTRGLELRPERQITIGAGTAVNLIDDVTVALDGIDLTDLTILHVPLSSSPIFATLEEAYFDGAIGYDLLRRCVVEIDYVNRLVVLTQSSRDVASDASWSVLPIALAGRVPVVDVKLQDHRSRSQSASLIVDTGAPSYVYVNPELVKRIDMPARNYLTRGRAFNGPYERVTARLAAFAFGGFEFPGLVTLFDRTDFKDLRQGVGLIGNGVLRNFDLIFDYRAGTLAMRRNANFDAASRTDRSGIDLQPHRSGAIVRSVAPGSGASKLGLQAGDVVTHIDGQSVGESTFDATKELLSSQRQSLALCWRSQATQSCESLQLADRL